MLLAMNLVLFGVPALDLLFFAGCLVAALFFLESFGRRERGGRLRVAVDILLVALSLVTNFLFLLMVVAVAFNLPKAPPYKPEIRVERAPVEQEVAFETLMELTALSTGSQDESSETLREEVLDLLAGSVPSVPLEKVGELYVLPLDFRLPFFFVLRDIFDEELKTVEFLLRQGEVLKAQTRYMRLWKAADNELSGQNSMIQTMVGLTHVELLTQFYEKHAGELGLAGNTELADLLRHVVSETDLAVENSIRVESSLIQGGILTIGAEEIPEGVTAPSPWRRLIARMVARRLLEWPFYDRNDTLRVQDTLTADMLQASRTPLYEQSEAYGNLERFVEETRGLSLLRNPVGRILLAIGVPQTMGPVERKEKVKSRVIATEYMLRALGPGAEPPVPVDNVTGENFHVEQDDGVVTIQGEDFSIQAQKY